MRRLIKRLVDLRKQRAVVMASIDTDIAEVLDKLEGLIEIGDPDGMDEILIRSLYEVMGGYKTLSKRRKRATREQIRDWILDHGEICYRSIAIELHGNDTRKGRDVLRSQISRMRRDGWIPGNLPVIKTGLPPEA